MSKNLFIPITKVDQVKRLVYGIAAVEEADKTDEIFDYASSKPLFEAWSAEANKFSGGKSLGNVRAMHGKVAAGRLDQITFNDDGKMIEVCAKIVDDNEWNKVEEGVYTGFSIGGKYEKRWKDGEFTRYTASPSEVSIVDNPCQPSARFTMTKADGSVEERPFAAKETSMASNDEIAAHARVLAKAAGDETKWTSFIEKAAGELNPVEVPITDAPVADAVVEAPAVEAPAETPAVAEKAETATPNKPAPDLEQVWKARDGQTFGTKAEAKAHNDGLEKADSPAARLIAATAELTGTVESVEKARTDAPAEDADYDEQVLRKKDYSDDDRKDMAGSGQAMKDGSFPIKTTADLKNAVQAYGRAKDKVAAKKHIIARAKSLGATDLLPADWEGSTKKADKAEGADETAPKRITKASGRPADEKALAKGLDTVARLASLIQSLEWLQQETEWEAVSENDGSPRPQQIKENIASLCVTLKDMVQEETSELFDGDETDAYGAMLEAAHAPRGIDALAKVLGDKAPALLAKVGARHSASDLKKVQAMHDTSVDLGASCGSADKSAPAGDLEKVAAERDDLLKAVQETLPLMKALQERIKRLEDQPMPRPGEGGPFKVVDKAADDDRVAADELSKTIVNNPEAVALALFKLAQANPQKMTTSR